MGVPQDRKYLETHEWHFVDGNTVTIGITQFAADQLSDITYVELPAVGAEIKAESVFGEIESVKATSELYSAVTGKVLEVNAALEDAPELVNSDCYGEGWFFALKPGQPDELKALLTAEAYTKLLQAETS